MLAETQTRDLAVVVASWQPLASLASCLAAVGRAVGKASVEVLVVRSPCAASEEEDFLALLARYPEARRLVALPGAGVAELRTIGARSASAEFVALIEDHCRPAEGWCDAAVALAERWSAVGGPIRNLSRERLTDRAAYFAEYGDFAPFPPGEELRLQAPSGANAVYRRELLLRALGELEGQSPWEGPLHATLVRLGTLPVLAASLAVEQARSPELGSALRERFLHGRHHAEERLAATRPGFQARARNACGAVVGPVALFARAGWRAWRSGPADARDFLVSAPLTSMLLLAWAAGQLARYAASARRTAA